MACAGNLVSITLILMSLNCVNLSPVSVHNGASFVDDLSQHRNRDIFDTSSKKSLTEENLNQGFNKENENSHNLAQDYGYANHEENNRKQHQNGGLQSAQQYENQNSAGVTQMGQQGGHKKGHHKSGFQNSYHKEESGNNSSFYDDADDHGGHYAYNSQDGAYGKAGESKNHGSFGDGSLYSKENSQRGVYDRAGHYNTARKDQNGYGQQQFLDNRHELGKSNLGSARGEAGRRVEEIYYQPHHVPPHITHQETKYPLAQFDRRYQPRKTITVYEDPREFDYYDPRYYTDQVQLDYRRKPLAYYPRQQPAFDYYY